MEEFKTLKEVAKTYGINITHIESKREIHVSLQSGDKYNKMIYDYRPSYSDSNYSFKEKCIEIANKIEKYASVVKQIKDLKAYQMILKNKTTKGADQYEKALILLKALQVKPYLFDKDLLEVFVFVKKELREKGLVKQA